jgi:hypothetical protein
MRGRHTRTRRLQGRAPATEPTLNQLNFGGPHALEKRKEAVGRTRIWQDNAGSTDMFCAWVARTGRSERPVARLVLLLRC